MTRPTLTSDQVAAVQPGDMIRTPHGWFVIKTTEDVTALLNCWRRTKMIFATDVNNDGLTFSTTVDETMPAEWIQFTSRGEVEAMRNVAANLRSALEHMMAEVSRDGQPRKGLDPEFACPTMIHAYGLATVALHFADGALPVEEAA